MSGRTLESSARAASGEAHGSHEMQQAIAARKAKQSQLPPGAHSVGNEEHLWKELENRSRARAQPHCKQRRRREEKRLGDQG